MPVKYQKACHVCNSKHKAIIEELADRGFNPDKIYAHLQSMLDPKDKKIVMQEDLKPSTIRRHLQRHYSKEEEKTINVAEVKTKQRQSRENLNKGIKIEIDRVNTLAHLIQLCLLRLEEIEVENNPKKHQHSIQYIGQLKGLIDEYSELAGNMKDEGTIDANFFKTEINTFAEIVLSTIRALDMKYQMDFQLEVDFSAEFKRQMVLYRQRQDLILAGKLSPKDGEKERNINKFNDASSLV